MIRTGSDADGILGLLAVVLLDRTGVPAAVEEVVRVIAQQDGHGALGAVALHPFDAVGDDLADVGVVVDREVLVARGEEEDLAVTAAEGAAGPENLPTTEGGDEDQLVGRGDVEE